MRSAALRISGTLGVGEFTAVGLALASIAVTGIIIVVGTSRGGLIPVLGLALAFFLLAISFRWPMLPLAAYAALIPIEELFVLGSLGTISRYVGIMFVVAYGLPRLGRLRISVMPTAAWAFLGWAILSITWALDPKVTLDRLSILLLLAVVGTSIAIAVAERPAIVRPLLWAYSLSAAVTASVGIYLYVQGGNQIEGRVAALPGQDPAHYAALLLPALAFSLHELIKHRLVVLSAAVAFLCLAGVLVSGTRGAWVSAALVIILFIIPRLARTRRHVVLAAIIVGAVVSLQLPGVGSFVVDRAGNAVESGGAGRTDIWTVGVTIIKSAPVAGVGLGNFSVAYSPETVRDSNVGNYAANHLEDTDPHSIIVGTIAELGVVGFVLLCLFLLPLLVRPGWGSQGPAVQAALGSLVISALFLDVLYRKQVWFVIGIACGLGYLARTQRAQRASRSVRASATAIRSNVGVPTGAGTVTSADGRRSEL